MRSSGGGADEERANDATRNRVMDEVKKAFRPEFLNRVDEVIVFDPLSADQIFQIVDLMLERVNKQIKTQDLTLELTPDVKEFLANEGFDKAMGARPLRRAVQRLIEDPLAEEVLRGTFRQGDTIMAFMDDDKKIAFKHKPIDEGLPKAIEPGEEAASDEGLPPYEEPAAIG